MSKKNHQASERTNKYGSEKAEKLRETLRRASDNAGVGVTAVQAHLKGRNHDLDKGTIENIHTSIRSDYGSIQSFLDDMHKHL